MVIEINTIYGGVQNIEVENTNEPIIIKKWRLKKTKFGVYVKHKDGNEVWIVKDECDEIDFPDFVPEYIRKKVRKMINA